MHNISFAPTYLSFVANVSKVHQPYSFQQAKQDPKWVEVMKKEIDALESNGTWHLTTLPK